MILTLAELQPLTRYRSRKRRALYRHIRRCEQSLGIELLYPVNGTNNKSGARFMVRLEEVRDACPTIWDEPEANDYLDIGMRLHSIEKTLADVLRHVSSCARTCHSTK